MGHQYFISTSAINFQIGSVWQFNHLRSAEVNSKSHEIRKEGNREQSAAVNLQQAGIHGLATSTAGDELALIFIGQAHSEQDRHAASH